MPDAPSTRAFGPPLTLPRPDAGQAGSVPHFAQVSELAYQLWKNSGFASGTELEYWYEAEQQLFAAKSADEPRAGRSA